MHPVLGDFLRTQTDEPLDVLQSALVALLSVFDRLDWGDEARAQKFGLALVQHATRVGEHVETLASRGLHDWEKFHVVLNNLGRALSLFGDRADELAPFNAAGLLYVVALQGVDRREAPLTWAALMTKLGCALRTLGGGPPFQRRLIESNAANLGYIPQKIDRPVNWQVMMSNLDFSRKALFRIEMKEQRAA